jgi:hypothetical protein
MQDIITVRELPTKESRRTSVNLLPLKGICPWSLSRALMHSFNASKLLLISAPSILEFKIKIKLIKPNRHSDNTTSKSLNHIDILDGYF